MKKTGLMIVIVGAILTALALFDFTFFTREKVVQVGDLQINARKQHSIPWTPFAGFAIMIVGGGVYLLRNKRSFLN